MKFRTMTRGLIVGAGALCLVACGNAKAPDGEAAAISKAAEAPKAETPKVDPVAAARARFEKTVMPELAKAATPESLVLAFEVAMDARNRVVFAAPKGWEASTFVPGSYKPNSESNLGFMTKYSVGTNCDGVCETKDWAAVSESVNFAQYRDAERFKIISETELKDPAGRLIVAETPNGKRRYIAAARWNPGATHYATCMATLEDGALSYQDVFAKACAAATPLEDH